jgi:hypothetical protein
MDPDLWDYLKYILSAVGVFGAGIITAMGLYIKSKDKDYNSTIVSAFDKVTESINNLTKTINSNTNLSREDLLKHRLKLEAAIEKLILEIHRENP